MSARAPSASVRDAKSGVALEIEAALKRLHDLDREIGLTPSGANTDAAAAAAAAAAGAGARAATLADTAETATRQLHREPARSAETLLLHLGEYRHTADGAVQLDLTRPETLLEYSATAKLSIATHHVVSVRRLLEGLLDSYRAGRRRAVRINSVPPAAVLSALVQLFCETFDVTRVASEGFIVGEMELNITVDHWKTTVCPTKAVCVGHDQWTVSGPGLSQPSLPLLVAQAALAIDAVSDEQKAGLQYSTCFALALLVVDVDPCVRLCRGGVCKTLAPCSVDCGERVAFFRVDWDQLQFLDCVLFGGRALSAASSPSASLVVSPLILFHDTGDAYSVDVLGHALLHRHMQRGQRTASWKAANPLLTSDLVPGASPWTVAQVVDRAFLQVAKDGGDALLACAMFLLAETVISADADPASAVSARTGADAVGVPLRHPDFGTQPPLHVPARGTNSARKPKYARRQHVPAHTFNPRAGNAAAAASAADAAAATAAVAVTAEPK